MIWIRSQLHWLKTDPTGQMVLMGILAVFAIICLIFICKSLVWVKRNAAKVFTVTGVLGLIAYLLLHYGHDTAGLVLIGGMILTILLGMGLAMGGKARTG